MSKREIAFASALTVGLGLITYGLGLAWMPAWWIAAGISVIVLAVLTLVEVR